MVHVQFAQRGSTKEGQTSSPTARSARLEDMPRIPTCPSAGFVQWVCTSQMLGSPAVQSVRLVGLARWAAQAARRVHLENSGRNL